MHYAITMKENESLANGVDHWEGFVLGNSSFVRETLPFLEMMDPKSPCGQY